MYSRISHAVRGSHIDDCTSNLKVCDTLSKSPKENGASNYKVLQNYLLHRCCECAGISANYRFESPGEERIPPSTGHHTRERSIETW